jgi:hypothetical protein
MGFLERLKGQRQTTIGDTELDVKRDKVPEPALPPVPRTPPVSPGREKFILTCVCAVEDRGYELVFARQPSGRLRYVESVKLTGRAGSANARAAASQRIAMADFEEGRWPCAWCGNGSFSQCDCGGLVCQGRQVGDLFRCRDSCGKEWRGVPLLEVQTSKETSRSQSPSTHAARGPSLPADTGARALTIRR